VSEYDPGTGTIDTTYMLDTTYMTDIDFLIVGARVSTFTPIAPPAAR